MVDFDEFEKMIKKVGKWINETFTTGLVIFHSLFTEFLQTEEILFIKSKILLNPLSVSDLFIFPLIFIIYVCV